MNIDFVAGMDLIKKSVQLNSNNPARWPGAWRNTTSDTNYYFDEDDNSAPSASTDGINLPDGTNRVSVLIDRGDRTSWTIVLWVRNKATGKWVCLPHVALDGITPAVANDRIELTIEANTVLFFELGGAFDRLLLQHVSTTGGTSGCKAYVVGSYVEAA